jgi:RHS repeat-associated protein
VSVCGLAGNGAVDAQANRFVGDPIDVVTGHVTDRTRCFRLIGPLFLEWLRFYDSGQHQFSRGFGYGHSHAYYYRLRFDADGFSLEDPVGKRTGFPPLLTDGERHTARGATLERITVKSYRLHRPGQPSLEFVFTAPEAPARIARVIRGNATIHFHSDGLGRLTGITHSTGLRINAEEDDRGRLLRLKGAWDGTTVKPILICEYDDAGNLIGMTDAQEACWSFDYDAANRMVRKTDRRGYSFLFEYDTAGRCVRSAGDDGVLGVVLRYRTEERITEVTKADGGVWKFFYDENGAVTLVVGPYGDARRFIKAEDGRTVGEIDPLGNSLEYVFDRSDALVGKRFSTGRTIEVRGDIDFANPPPHRYADRPLEWDYGELLSRLTVKAEVLPTLSAELRRALPSESEPRPASPQVPSFGINPWYPEPEPGREFSPFGHLIGQSLANGKRRHWTYDANDSMAVYTDADGAVTRQERRSWNQLDRWMDPLGIETKYRFTLQENLQSVTDGGGTTTEFAWDKENRLLGVRRAGSVRETYRYDDVGNLIEKRDGNGVTLLILVPTPDRLIAERHLASGGVHKFTYNAAGRFLTAAVDQSEVCFAYDAFAQRICDERDGKGVRHRFAGAGRLAETTVLGTYVIRYQEAGSEVTIRLPGAGSIRVDRLRSRLVRRGCSNGTVEISEYDELGRCIFRALQSGHTQRGAWVRRYGYSGEGDLLEIDDNRNGTIRYRYDKAHRLVAAEPQRGTAESFAYDAAGNLLAQPGLDGVEIAAGNQLAAANRERFVYNSRHHISQRQGPIGLVVYQYDSRDMLVAVERPDCVWQAEYDAIGRRVRAWQGEAEQRFFWDTDRLAAELFASGMLRIYVYADALALTPVAFVDYSSTDADPAEGAVRFVFADQRGAPVLVEDAKGNVLWEARLSPSGAATITALSGLAQNVRFPGHYFDASTGLHYNRFRYYDPLLGRYIQSDPIGIGGGVNVYSYPLNPLVRVDVRGHCGGDGSDCDTPCPPESGEDDDGRELPFPMTETERRRWEGQLSPAEADSAYHPDNVQARRAEAAQEYASRDVRRAAADLASGTDTVHTASTAEAEQIVLLAYPGAKDCTSPVGAPPDFSNFKGKDDNGMYHRDYDRDPNTGKIYGHGEDNPHGDDPHINVKRPDGSKAVVIVDDDD